MENQIYQSECGISPFQMRFMLWRRVFSPALFITIVVSYLLNIVVLGFETYIFVGQGVVAWVFSHFSPDAMISVSAFQDTIGKYPLIVNGHPVTAGMISASQLYQACLDAGFIKNFNICLNLFVLFAVPCGVAFAVFLLRKINEMKSTNDVEGGTE